MAERVEVLVDVLSDFAPEDVTTSELRQLIMQFDGDELQIQRAILEKWETTDISAEEVTDPAPPISLRDRLERVADTYRPTRNHFLGNKDDEDDDDASSKDDSDNDDGDADDKYTIDCTSSEDDCGDDTDENRINEPSGGLRALGLDSLGFGLGRLGTGVVVGATTAVGGIGRSIGDLVRRNSFVDEDSDDEETPSSRVLMEKKEKAASHQGRHEPGDIGRNNQNRLEATVSSLEDDLYVMVERREESRRLWLNLTLEHLNEFLEAYMRVEFFPGADSQAWTAFATYERWISELHPENASCHETNRREKASEQENVTNCLTLTNSEVCGAPKLSAKACTGCDSLITIDARFYLPDSDHLLMWNQHPLVGVPVAALASAHSGSSHKVEKGRAGNSDDLIDSIDGLETISAKSEDTRESNSVMEAIFAPAAGPDARAIEVQKAKVATQQRFKEQQQDQEKDKSKQLEGETNEGGTEREHVDDVTRYGHVPEVFDLVLGDRVEVRDALPEGEMGGVWERAILESFDPDFSALEVESIDEEAQDALSRFKKTASGVVIHQNSTARCRKDGWDTGYTWAEVQHVNWPPSRLRGQCPGARTSYSSSTEIEVDDEEEEDEEDDASKETEDEMLAQDEYKNEKMKRDIQKKHQTRHQKQPRRCKENLSPKKGEQAGTSRIACGALSLFRTPMDGYSCSRCRATFDAHTRLFGCRTCNFDLCELCVEGRDASTIDTPVNFARPTFYPGRHPSVLPVPPSSSSDYTSSGRRSPTTNPSARARREKLDQAKLAAQKFMSRASRVAQERRLRKAARREERASAKAKAKRDAALAREKAREARQKAKEAQVARGPAAAAAAGGGRGAGDVVSLHGGGGESADRAGSSAAAGAAEAPSDTMVSKGEESSTASWTAVEATSLADAAWLSPDVWAIDRSLCGAAQLNVATTMGWTVDVGASETKTIVKSNSSRSTESKVKLGSLNSFSSSEQSDGHIVSPPPLPFLSPEVPPSARKSTLQAQQASTKAAKTPAPQAPATKTLVGGANHPEAQARKKSIVAYHRLCMRIGRIWTGQRPRASSVSASTKAADLKSPSDAMLKEDGYSRSAHVEAKSTATPTRRHSSFHPNTPPSTVHSAMKPVAAPIGRLAALRRAIRSRYPRTLQLTITGPRCLPRSAEKELRESLHFQTTANLSDGIADASLDGVIVPGNVPCPADLSTTFVEFENLTTGQCKRTDLLGRFAAQQHRIEMSSDSSDASAQLRTLSVGLVVSSPRDVLIARLVVEDATNAQPRWIAATTILGRDQSPAAMNSTTSAEISIDAKINGSNIMKTPDVKNMDTVALSKTMDQGHNNGENAVFPNHSTFQSSMQSLAPSTATPDKLHEKNSLRSKKDTDIGSVMESDNENIDDEDDFDDEEFFRELQNEQQIEEEALAAEGLSRITMLPDESTGNKQYHARTPKKNQQKSSRKKKKKKLGRFGRIRENRIPSDEISGEEDDTDDDDNDANIETRENNAEGTTGSTENNDIKNSLSTTPRKYQRQRKRKEKQKRKKENVAQQLQALLGEDSSSITAFSLGIGDFDCPLLGASLFGKTIEKTDMRIENRGNRDQTGSMSLANTAPSYYGNDEDAFCELGIVATWVEDEVGATTILEPSFPRIIDLNLVSAAGLVSDPIFVRCTPSAAATVSSPSRAPISPSDNIAADGGSAAGNSIGCNAGSKCGPRINTLRRGGSGSFSERVNSNSNISTWQVTSTEGNLRASSTEKQSLAQRVRYKHERRRLKGTRRRGIITFDTQNARDAISEFMSLEEAGGHDVEADIAQYEADSAVTAVVEVVNITTGERFRTPRVRGHAHFIEFNERVQLQISSPFDTIIISVRHHHTYLPSLNVHRHASKKQSKDIVRDVKVSGKSVLADLESRTQNRYDDSSTDDEKGSTSEMDAEDDDDDDDDDDEWWQDLIRTTDKSNCPISFVRAMTSCHAQLPLDDRFLRGRGCAVPLRRGDGVSGNGLSGMAMLESEIPSHGMLELEATWAPVPTEKPRGIREKLVKSIQSSTPFTIPAR